MQMPAQPNGETEPRHDVEPIRAAVVGVGTFGERHLRAYRRLHGVEVVAVADADQRRAEKVAFELDVPKVFTTATELLDSVGPDAISVATSERAHFEPAAEALRRGVAVLVEKPMTLDLDEATALVQLADESDGILVPGHVLRFASPYRKLQEEIAGGAIGHVLAIAARRDRSRAHSDRYADVHPALLTAVHDIDLALWVTAQRPVRVRALEQRLPGLSQPSIVSVHVETEDGPYWSLSTAFLHACEVVSDRFEVYGTNGVAAVEPRGSEWLEDALVAQLEHFERCVRAHRPSALVPPREALTGLRIAHAIVGSAREGGEPMLLEAA